MDEVAESGEEIVVTKNDHPVTRLVAYRTKFEEFFGADKGKLEILGDFISPMDVDWEVDTDPDRVLFL
jgi:antitoxin (DNA-binding transcriptional repressor) of toxin-antitoxin stability system